jgi:hypothetical protein
MAKLSILKSNQAPPPQPPNRAKGAKQHGLEAPDYPSTPVGQTDHVQLLCANSLGQAGIDLGNRLLQQMEADAVNCARLFGMDVPSYTVFIAPLSQGNDGTGGAYHYGCQDTLIYADADYTGDKTAALFLAEAVEVMEAQQNSGWDCGASAGEGLSRAVAELLHPGVLDAYSTAGAWLDNGRPNYVDESLPSDLDEMGNGCSVLFLFWLAALGYAWEDIIAAGGTTLSQMYETLTGETGAWETFSAVCEYNWPSGQRSGVTTDNPWPDVDPTGGSESGGKGGTTGGDGGSGAPGGGTSAPPVFSSFVYLSGQEVPGPYIMVPLPPQLSGKNMAQMGGINWGKVLSAILVAVLGVINAPQEEKPKEGGSTTPPEPPPIPPAPSPAPTSGATEAPAQLAQPAPQQEPQPQQGQPAAQATQATSQRYKTRPPTTQPYGQPPQTAKLGPPKGRKQPPA